MDVKLNSTQNFYAKFTTNNIVTSVGDKLSFLPDVTNITSVTVVDKESGSTLAYNPVTGKYEVRLLTLQDVTGGNNEINGGSF